MMRNIYSITTWEYLSYKLLIAMNFCSERILIVLYIYIFLILFPYSIMSDFKDDH